MLGSANKALRGQKTATAAGQRPAPLEEVARSHGKSAVAVCLRGARCEVLGIDGRTIGHLLKVNLARKKKEEEEEERRKVEEMEQAKEEEMQEIHRKVRADLTSRSLTPIVRHGECGSASLPPPRPLLEEMTFLGFLRAPVFWQSLVRRLPRGVQEFGCSGR